MCLGIVQPLGYCHHVHTVVISLVRILRLPPSSVCNAQASRICDDAARLTQTPRLGGVVQTKVRREWSWDVILQSSRNPQTNNANQTETRDDARTVGPATSQQTSGMCVYQCLAHSTTLPPMLLLRITDQESAVVTAHAPSAAVLKLRRLTLGECSSRRGRNPCPAGLRWDG